MSFRTIVTLCVSTWLQSWWDTQNLHTPCLSGHTSHYHICMRNMVLLTGVKFCSSQLYMHYLKKTTKVYLKISLIKVWLSISCLSWNAARYVVVKTNCSCLMTGAHNEKEHLTTGTRLSSNTLCLTIYSKWRDTLSAIILFTSQLCRWALQALQHSINIISTPT